MGLFSKKKKGDMSDVSAYNKKAVSYVVERNGAEENVIGRTGAVSVDDEKLVVMCDGHEVVRLSLEGIICAELMSHNGADIKGTDDGCVINGVPRLKGGRIDHLGDHRLMMSAAVASLISDGPVSMDDDSCWNVSYPGFVEQMRSIGLRC